MDSLRERIREVAESQGLRWKGPNFGDEILQERLGLLRDQLSRAYDELPYAERAQYEKRANNGRKAWIEERIREERPNLERGLPHIQYVGEGDLILELNSYFRTPETSTQDNIEQLRENGRYSRSVEIHTMDGPWILNFLLDIADDIAYAYSFDHDPRSDPVMRKVHDEPPAYCSDVEAVLEDVRSVEAVPNAVDKAVTRIRYD